MISLTQKSPVKPSAQAAPPLRFGQEDGDRYFRRRSDVLALTELIRQMDRGAEDFAVINRGETPPSGRRDAAQSRMTRGAMAMGGFVAALVMLLGGVNRLSAYGDSKPPAGVVSLHNDMVRANLTTTVRDLIEIAEEAETLGISADREAEFVKQVQALSIDLQRFMAEHPERLSAELASILAASPEFMPTVSTAQMAGRFTQYMERELNRVGVTPGQALPTDLNRIDLMEFLDSEEALAHLSAEEKANLAEQLKAKYLKVQVELLQNLLIDNYFIDMFAGIEGVSLEAFQHISTKQDVAELYEQVIRNSPHIDERHKQPLIDRGVEILDAYDYPPAQTSWLALGIGLILAALATTGVAVFFGGKEIAGLPGAFKAYQAAGKNPTLVIERIDQTDPDARQTLNLAAMQIHAAAGDIVRLMERAQSDPSINSLLEEKYPQGLPNAETIIQKYIFDLRQTLLQQQSGNSQPIVDELKFIDRLASQMNFAAETGNLGILGLSSAISHSDELPANITKLPLADQLQLRYAQTEQQLRQARNLLLQNMLEYHHAKEQAAQLQQDVDQLTQSFEGRIQATDEELAPLAQKQTLLEAAQAHQEVVRASFESAKRSLVQMIQQLQQMQLQISQAMTQSLYADSMKALQQLQSSSEAMMNDPVLQELLNQAELKSLVAQARQELDEL